MDIRIQGYANQIKLFLILLVLFLTAAGLVGLRVLYRAQSLLMAEANGRITSASRAAHRELIESGLTGPTPPSSGEAAGSLLSGLAEAYSLRSVEIVGLDGLVMASTEPWRLGLIDPEGADAGRSALADLQSGAIVIRETPESGASGAPNDGEHGAEAVAFLALWGDQGEVSALLKTTHELVGARAASRQIRLLAWTQALAGCVVLGLVLLFVKWVLRPYRALRATAAQIGSRQPLVALDEPEDLIASFQGVIQKLKTQEDELERMRSHAAPDGRRDLSQEWLAGLTSGVLIVSQEGRVRGLNPAGERILGAGAGQICGRDFRDAFASAPAFLALLKKGIEQGRPLSREVVPYVPIRGRRSSPAHLGVSITTLPGPPPSGGGVFCLFTDLTEIRGLQELVHLKEKLAGLGEMSAGIAHEFRNSLATILGYARLIEREGATGDSKRENAAAIVREVGSIGRVVDEFLWYARPARLQRSTWDPRAVITDVAREVEQEMVRPGVIFNIGGDWPETLTADEALLRQTFKNLLRNAAEAIHAPPGQVTVTGYLEPAEELLKIEVADTGEGITQELLDRLFTPFVTTKRGGVGLGLAMAQKAIVSHDGAISAHNLEDGGACFVINLPWSAIAAREDQRPI